LRKRGIYQARPGWAKFFGQLAGALFLLSGVTMWVAGHFDWIAMQAHPFLRMGALLLVMAVGAAVYFGALVLTGFRLADFKRIAR
jgi:putative peptidoglycan lipid II flippase